MLFFRILLPAINIFGKYKSKTEDRNLYCMMFCLLMSAFSFQAILADKKGKKTKIDFPLQQLKSKNLTRSALAPTMLSPKLSYLPLLLIIIFLLAQKLAAQPRMIRGLTSNFPPHTYRYDRQTYNNFRITIKYRHTKASCFQIWLYENNTNLAAEPQFKSETYCGNFTIARSWNYIRHYRVVAVQLKQFRIDYRLQIQQFDIWTRYLTPVANFTGTMFQPFPNLPVVTVDPYVSSLFFQAPEAYFVYQRQNANETYAYFLSESGNGYCLKRGEYSEVYTKISSNMLWTFLPSIKLQHALSVVPFTFDITIYVDMQLNAPEADLWNSSQQQCTSNLPPSSDKKEDPQKKTQHFLFVCKIGLTVILAIAILL